MKTNHRPPKVFQKLLQWFCHPTYYEELEGDLLEHFYNDIQDRDLSYAQRRYRIEVLKLFRPSVIKRISLHSFKISPIMFRTHFKLAFRTLFKQKLAATINLFGLTIGITAFLFASLFTRFENSYDNFHADPETLYRVVTKRYKNNELIYNSSASVPPLAAAMRQNLTSIAGAARMYKGDGSIVTKGEAVGGKRESFDEDRMYYAESELLSVLSFNLLVGDQATALSKPRNLVLSRQAAEKYFGSAAAALHQNLTVFHESVELEYTISGVFENQAPNAHFKPDFLMSFITLTQVVHPDFPIEGNWAWVNYHTYLRLTDKEDVALVTQQINQLLEAAVGSRFRERDIKVEFALQRVKDIHLHSNLEHEHEQNGSTSRLLYVSIACFMILLIAIQNYVSLASTMVSKRSTEVGIRKAIGVSKGSLRNQFYIESFLLNFLASIAAVLILAASLPVINKFATTHLTIVDLISPYFMAAVLFILVLSTLLGAFYPAQVLSNINITAALKSKGVVRLAHRAWVNKMLVVGQFAMSILLIMTAQIVHQQVNYLTHRDLGMDISQTFSLKLPVLTDQDEVFAQYDLLKKELSNHHSIAAVSTSATLPGAEMGWTADMYHTGGSSNDQKRLHINLIDYDYFQITGLNLVAGTVFSEERAGSNQIIINQAGARSLGFGEDPSAAVGQSMNWYYSPLYPREEVKIVGVVEDYQQRAYEATELPIVYSLHRQMITPWSSSINVLVKPTAVGPELLAEVAASWQGIFPLQEFNYRFLEDSFAQYFVGYQQFGVLIRFFTLLAIFLSSLGLFGLAAFYAAQRTKEIGIRKVLGASIPDILLLLWRQFIYLIVLAFIIGAPLAYWIGNNWLQHFTLRIFVGADLFIISAIGALVLALVTISYHTLGAALANPVKTLKE